jgi:hypothetical protein
MKGSTLALPYLQRALATINLTGGQFPEGRTAVSLIDNTATREGVRGLKSLRAVRVTQVKGVCPKNQTKCKEKKEEKV